MVVLAYHIVDLGGLTILAREMQQKRTKGSLKRLFWSGSIVRLMLSLILVVFCAMLYYLGDSHSFVASYALSASIGTLAYSFNAIGILDGLHRSRWSGLTWAIPFVFSAVILPLVADIPLSKAGFWLGGVFSLGAVLGTGMQHILLIKSGFALTIEPINRSSALFFLREGTLYLLSWGAGQFFYRGQIAICAAQMDIRLVGIFVYTKQVVNGMNQILFFLRRAEFPHLVSVVRNSPQKCIITGLLVQQASLLGSFAAVLAMASGGIFLWQFGPDQFQETGRVFAALAITIPSSAFYSTFNQICIAAERMELAAWCAVAVTGIGLGIQWVVVPHGWIALSLGEVAIHLIGMCVISFGFLGATDKLSLTKDDALRKDKVA